MGVPDFTKTMKALAFAAIALCLFMFGWTVWYDRSLEHEDPFGYRNLKLCAKIEPGVDEAGIVAKLGAPERAEDVGGVRRLSFHTLAAASAPIQADVDPATGAVVELRCRDDGKPTWSARR
jgi:hypothetical protein